MIYRSPCRWKTAAGAAGLAGLFVLFLVFASGTPGQGPQRPAAGGRPLTPFLQDFMARKAPPVTARQVRLTSAVGPVSGYLARPDTTERLPAVLLLHDERGLTDWMKENTRDLAGIGYVVLALDLPAGTGHGVGAALADEKTLAQSSAAVRWLRRRSDVLPGQVGVVGWAQGGERALALAASTPVQACVVCDAAVTDDPVVVAGLRATAVLVVVAGRDQNARKTAAAFQKALTAAHLPCKLCVYDDVRAGFMGPPDRASYVETEADRAWIQVYEFLGKYVEDAPQNPAALPAPAGAKAAAATIADIMQAVNQPTGVRGTLAKALEQAPATPRQWERVRANAALMVEAAGLLQGLTPPRGTRGGWLEQVAAYRDAAESMVTAADRRDYAAARRGLEQVAGRCTACHDQHR